MLTKGKTVGGLAVGGSIADSYLLPDTFSVDIHPTYADTLDAYIHPTFPDSWFVDIHPTSANSWCVNIHPTLANTWIFLLCLYLCRHLCCLDRYIPWMTHNLSS